MKVSVQLWEKEQEEEQEPSHSSKIQKVIKACVPEQLKRMFREGPQKPKNPSIRIMPDKRLRQKEEIIREEIALAIKSLIAEAVTINTEGFSMYFNERELYDLTFHISEEVELQKEEVQRKVEELFPSLEITKLKIVNEGVDIAEKDST